MGLFFNEASKDPLKGPQDVYGRLLAERIVFVNGALDVDNANRVIAQLLLLEREGGGGDISMYINSEGGDVQHGLAVYDTTRSLSCDVAPVCVGVAGIPAVLLLAGGAPGKRSALTHARMVLSQPSGSVQGKTADIDLRAREYLILRHRVNELLARHTGQSLERIERDTRGELWMTSEEAKAYGIIDEVLSRMPRRNG